jgi:hypothetical protein
MIRAYDKPKPKNASRKIALLLEPVLLDRKRAALSLGVSIRTLDGLVKDGALRSVQLGGRRMFRPADLRAFADSLPAAGPTGNMRIAS